MTVPSDPPPSSASARPGAPVTPLFGPAVEEVRAQHTLEVDTVSTHRSRWIRSHLLYGWGGLFLFALLGLVLEGLHAWKVPLYLDAGSETRRLLFRLAHAHGTLLSLLQLGFASTLEKMPTRLFPRPLGLASGTLTGALLLLPMGFFLGGVEAVEGDPGSGIFLVPLGALLLLVALGTTFFSCFSAGKGK